MSPHGEDLHVVGLAAETAQLEALLDRSRAGGPVVAVVEGPAGIGKTTLLRRFLRRHPGLPTTTAPGLPWESRRTGALAGFSSELAADPDELLFHRCDILIPAAMEQVTACALAEQSLACRS